MRALRDPDAFLPTDLGVRHALERLGRDPAEAVALAEPWRPVPGLRAAAPVGVAGLERRQAVDPPSAGRSGAGAGARLRRATSPAGSRTSTVALSPRTATRVIAGRRSAARTSFGSPAAPCSTAVAHPMSPARRLTWSSTSRERLRREQPARGLAVAAGHGLHLAADGGGRLLGVAEPWRRRGGRSASEPPQAVSAGQISSAANARQRITASGRSSRPGGRSPARTPASARRRWSGPRTGSRAA